MRLPPKLPAFRDKPKQLGKYIMPINPCFLLSLKLSCSRLGKRIGRLCSNPEPHCFFSRLRSAYSVALFCWCHIPEVMHRFGAFTNPDRCCTYTSCSYHGSCQERQGRQLDYALQAKLQSLQPSGLWSIHRYQRRSGK